MYKLSSIHLSGFKTMPDLNIQVPRDEMKVEPWQFKKPLMNVSMQELRLASASQFSLE